MKHELLQLAAACRLAAYLTALGFCLRQRAYLGAIAAVALASAATLQVLDATRELVAIAAMPCAFVVAAVLIQRTARGAR